MTDETENNGGRNFSDALLIAAEAYDRSMPGIMAMKKKRAAERAVRDAAVEVAYETAFEEAKARELEAAPAKTVGKRVLKDKLCNKDTYMTRKNADIRISRAVKDRTLVEVETGVYTQSSVETFLDIQKPVQKRESTDIDYM